MRPAALASALLLVFGLAGCTKLAVVRQLVLAPGAPNPSAFDTVSPPRPNADGVVVVELRHISPALASFGGEERYDFLGDISYEPIGEHSFDAFAYSSARLAANLVQIGQTLSAYRSGDLGVGQDLDFLLAMTSHSIQVLPQIIPEARGVLEAGRSLTPQALEPSQWTSALRLLDTSRSNLMAVMDSGPSVTEATGGYSDLYDDLCAAMGETDCPTDP